MTDLVRVFNVNGLFSVSYDKVWVPGLYATEPAARLAATVWPTAPLKALEHIWRFDGEDRGATLEEVQGAIDAAASSPTGDPA